MSLICKMPQCFNNVTCTKVQNIIIWIINLLGIKSKDSTGELKAA